MKKNDNAVLIRVPPQGTWAEQPAVNWFIASGLAIRPGWILTARHTFQNQSPEATKCLIQFSGTDKWFDATSKWQPDNDTDDLVLLQYDGNLRPNVQVMELHPPEKDSRLHGLGYPVGAAEGVVLQPFLFEVGIIGEVTNKLQLKNTTFPTGNPDDLGGLSGAGLVNPSGHLVAVMRSVTKKMETLYATAVIKAWEDARFRELIDPRGFDPTRLHRWSLVLLLGNTSRKPNVDPADPLDPAVRMRLEDLLTTHPTVLAKFRDYLIRIKKRTVPALGSDFVAYLVNAWISEANFHMEMIQCLRTLRLPGHFFHPMFEHLIPLEVDPQAIQGGRIAVNTPIPNPVQTGQEVPAWFSAMLTAAILDMACRLESVSNKDRPEVRIEGEHIFEIGPPTILSNPPNETVDLRTAIVAKLQRHFPVSESQLPEILAKLFLGTEPPAWLMVKDARWSTISAACAAFVPRLVAVFDTKTPGTTVFHHPDRDKELEVILSYPRPPEQPHA